MLITETSQTSLFDVAVRESVTRILDLRGGVVIPPVLAGITYHPSRWTAPIILNREVTDAVEAAVLLVLTRPDELEVMQQLIKNLRPTAEISLLIGVPHVV